MALTDFFALPEKMYFDLTMQVCLKPKPFDPTKPNKQQLSQVLAHLTSGGDVA